MFGSWRSLGAVGLLSVIAIWPRAILAGRPAQPSASGSAEQLLLHPATSQPASCGRYRVRDWLRQRFVRDSDLARYGLQLDDNWAQQPADKPVVIVVHGFNSSPLQIAPLMASIRAVGLPCGSFAYPNDHRILASAQLLSNELCRFRRQHPERHVALVCHSMGSLVARACIEDALYDSGNVDRLIMIAPPTHGTLVAYFAVGTDLWEHWLSRSDGGPWRRTRDSIIDGLGEAADDLCPRSNFLQELNGRRLNPRVKYSVLLGTSACFQEAQVDWIRESVCSEIAKLPGGQGGAERLDEVLSDIDELVDGKGDGVVAVKRGRLAGVSDTLVLPFGHLSVAGQPREEVQRSVQRAVLQRLQ